MEAESPVNILASSELSSFPSSSGRKLRFLRRPSLHWISMLLTLLCVSDRGFKLHYIRPFSIPRDRTTATLL